LSLTSFEVLIGAGGCSCWPCSSFSEPDIAEWKDAVSEDVLEREDDLFEDIKVVAVGRCAGAVCVRPTCGFEGA